MTTAISALDSLPEIAAVMHDTEGKLVLVKKGETGYWPCPDHIDARRLNEGLTERQLCAMKTCSILGWHEKLAAKLLK